MSRIAAPATPGRSSASATATSRATAGAKGERHRRDQRDHDESDEQRVLRGVEDPGERDLENGVQPVGDYYRDPDEDPRREQAARGPFRRRRGFQL